VILEAGLDGMSSNGAWMQPELAQQARVVNPAVELRSNLDQSTG
jgi:hypothetical protein